MAELSNRWRLHRYPWAGALSTAHTLLWYAHHGIDVFRRLGAAPPPRVPGAKSHVVGARHDTVELAAVAAENEAANWDELVRVRRSVRRADYQLLAAALPPARPSPGRFRIAVGCEPEKVEPSVANAGKAARRTPAGRRRSHASNATKR